MRLVEVEIENYKQYAGTHLFHPGEKAMVAIVGQNGAGKTTLFEAIEWCLYNPIPHQERHPHATRTGWQTAGARRARGSANRRCL